MSCSALMTFDRRAWSRLRADMPMSLSAAEARGLRGQLGEVSAAEVEAIYLPLARLLLLQAAAHLRLQQVTTRFLRQPCQQRPYLVGITGSVAVGKSTVCRILRALLGSARPARQVQVLNTDGYLWPGATLRARGLMQRKGFPESFDRRRLVADLTALKGGRPWVEVPLYSHHLYDRLRGQVQRLRRPRILLVEGVNVLQQGKDAGQPAAASLIDFGIYVDAPARLLSRWYLARFMLFRRQAAACPTAFFHRFAAMPPAAARALAKQVWQSINLANLRQHILPSQRHAHLILRKGASHQVEQVALRRG